MINKGIQKKLKIKYETSAIRYLRDSKTSLKSLYESMKEAIFIKQFDYNIKNRE